MVTHGEAIIGEHQEAWASCPLEARQDGSDGCPHPGRARGGGRRALLLPFARFMQLVLGNICQPSGKAGVCAEPCC